MKMEVMDINRRTLALCICVALMAVAANWLLGLNKIDGDTGLPAYTVVIEEDGSGTEYLGNIEVRTFGVDTFVWDCATMGNRWCG